MTRLSGDGRGKERERETETETDIGRKIEREGFCPRQLGKLEGGGCSSSIMTDRGTDVTIRAQSKHINDHHGTCSVNMDPDKEAVVFVDFTQLGR